MQNPYLKGILSNCILLLFTFCLNAQNSTEFFKQIPKLDESTPDWALSMYSEHPNVRSVEEAYQAYYHSHIFEKNIHTQNFKHWIRLVDPLTNEEGFIIQLSEEEKRTRDNIRRKQRATSKQNRSNNLTTWNNIGPNKTYRNDGSLELRPTQANIYCIAAAPSDSTLLYCGTESGGFFKSTDHGLNWSLTTADESFTNGADVKIHPVNPDIVYLATGRNIYKTIDAGQSWNLSKNCPATVEQLYIHQTTPNKIFAATRDGLYYTDDDGTTWTDIRAGWHWDIEANPKNPNTLYIATKNTTAIRAEIFKSTDGGTSWTLKDTDWYTPTDLANASDNGCKIGLTPADTNRVYTCLLGDSKVGDQNWIGVYYSLDGGNNWVDADGQDGGPYAPGDDMNTIWYANGYSSGYNQGWYNFDLDVSHNNADRIWIGTIWDLESNNRGANLEYFRGTRNLAMHPDVQDIEVIGNDVWIVSDGGINYSNDEFQTTEIRNTGITASNFWGFSQGWNEDTWTGGRYHNGDAVYHENFGVGNTMFMGGAESATGYINQFENRKSYYDDISSKILPDALSESSSSFSSLALYPNSTYTQLQSSEIEHDPRYGNHLYLGKDNIFYKSTDTGISFTALYSFPVNSLVLEFEIARQNPNLIYCLVRANNAGTIYKSLDGGISFTAITTIPSNNINYLDLSLDQENPDHLWVISRYGSDGNKVYATSDGGSTWVNKTTAALDGQQFLDVDYQTGSDDIVYLLSTSAVFYWDATNSDWVLYADGLPLVITEAREIELFYRDSKIRLSCGRGIWEAPFAGPSVPVVQPMTNTDKVYCSRDTVQMDCYSFIDHTGATWDWNFTPAPAYISSTSARNPRVVFDQDGVYDLTLTVTNGNGSSSKTVSEFITLENKCTPDTIPGYALQCSNSGDYASTPSMDITTNNFTISAWVKPNSVQPDYTGIVFNDGTSAGLNFGTGNTLAYHWPGGAWWWDSGLVVPTNEWSHVALVVTPDAITVYLNGEGATHTTTLDPAALGTMKMGSYKGWSSRNMDGEIDEVALWNRSLTQNEIREIRHLTRRTTLPIAPGLMVYYQFNNTESTDILDKVGVRKAVQNGNSTKVLSSAPIAGGTSHRLSVNAAGTYTFGTTGVEMTFGNIVPNGEVVVSQLHVLPNALPAATVSNSGNYWVVNNYGNPSFDALTAMKFDPLDSGFVNAVAGSPSEAHLYKRTSNQHLANWIDQCGATAAGSGTITFDNSCNQTNFSQFIIASGTLIPVELVSFTADAEEHKRVRLTWETAAELENDFFTIERSSDAQHWEKIIEVDAAGTSTALQAYSTYDQEPLKGISYYRLKQTDFDASFSYSEIRSVQIKTPNDRISLSPNPAKNSLTLMGHDAEKNGRLKIYSNNGKLKKDVFITDAHQNIDISNLNAGMYYYLFQGDDFLKTGKVIVE